MTVQADGALTAAFVADHDGFYRIEMEAAGGPRVGALAEVLDRRPDRSAADGVVHEAGARHLGVADRGSVPRGEGRGRLRRQDPRPGLQRQRRRREDRQAVRRDDADAQRLGRPHAVLRGDGREGGRLGVVLRARRRQRHGRGIAEGDERPVLRARAAARQGLQEGRVAGRRRRRRRRGSRTRSARSRSSSARSSRRRSTSSAIARPRAPQKLQRELGRRRADAEAPARAGQRAADQFRRPRREPGGAVQEDHRLPEAEHSRDADRRRASCRRRARMRPCRPSIARSSSCRRRRRSTRRR